jgi:hypothetical protein
MTRRHLKIFMLVAFVSQFVSVLAGLPQLGNQFFLLFWILATADAVITRIDAFERRVFAFEDGHKKD